VRRAKIHPGLGARQSEKQELEIVSAALRQQLDHQYHAPTRRKSRDTPGCDKTDQITRWLVKIAVGFVIAVIAFDGVHATNLLYRH